jgi:hypothetical protein
MKQRGENQEADFLGNRIEVERKDLKRRKKGSWRGGIFD